MKINFETIGDFQNTVDWLNRTIEHKHDVELHVIGRQGVEALSANTPVGATGQTARSWSYDIESVNNDPVLSFSNNAHPGESVNVALIKEIGHGTGTGGYVPPRPYIKQALNNLFETAGDRVMKEMLK